MSARFTDLIHRVTASCLLHPLANGRQDALDNHSSDEDEDSGSSGSEYESGEDGEYSMKWKEKGKNSGTVVDNRVIEMEALMNEVFEAVSTMKSAYVTLQEAHCPWDPEKMRSADVVVVAELRRIGMLKERFRRGCVIGNSGGEGRRGRGGGVAVRELVAPYEAAVDELKTEVKAKEVEVENLKEKLRVVTDFNSNGGKKGRSNSRKVGCITQVAASPVPELFEATIMQVNEASKSFTSLLLLLMRSAHWDIAAAVRSIEAATASSDPITITTSFATSIVSAHHAKYVLESYITRKIFQDFDHESFYMDGSLTSLLNPDQHRRDCFTQYRDMKSMDPNELLGILPTCTFGKFCCKKYLSIVHPKMEESLFGDLLQHHQVMAGSHPRTQFYGEFLGLAKAVWLLHLLAFSLDPAPVQFEASRGSEFHPQYMESVVKFSSGVPTGQTVGFPVSPGFKLGNGAIIKARVYVVARA